jgi:hypothetical protein
MPQYILAPESISTAYFINPTDRSVRLYVYSPIIARQRVDKNVTAATSTHNNRRIFGPFVFFAVCVVSKKRKTINSSQNFLSILRFNGKEPVIC